MCFIGRKDLEAAVPDCLAQDCVMTSEYMTVIPQVQRGTDISTFQLYTYRKRRQVLFLYKRQDTRSE